LQRCLGDLLSGKYDEAEFVEAVRGNCSESEFIDAIAIQLRASAGFKAKDSGRTQSNAKPREVSLDLVHFWNRNRRRTVGELQRPTVDLARNGTSCVVFGGPPPSPVQIGRVLRDRYVIEKLLGKRGAEALSSRHSIDSASSLPVAATLRGDQNLHAVTPRSPMQ